MAPEWWELVSFGERISRTDRLVSCISHSHAYKRLRASSTRARSENNEDLNWKLMLNSKILGFSRILRPSFPVPFTHLDICTHESFKNCPRDFMPKMKE